VLVTVIAKDYGMTAKKFNKLLHALGVQFRYKTNRTWLLYHVHDGKGYTITNTYYKGNGVYIHMCWTQKGRFFLYEYLKSHGILPMTERLQVS
jgi:phage antirepressor YoqD-like protein